MRILKKDFVNEDTESYCGGRRLSSGTAYFMQTENGAIVYGGKTCAEQHGDNDLRDVPDLTKSLIALRDGGNTVGGHGGGNGEERNYSLAVAYLLLREERLDEFRLNGSSISYNKLNEYYQYYQENRTLEESQVNHILNLESYAVQNIDAKLSLKNLATCHAYRFILSRIYAYLEGENNTDGMAFITSLQNYLSTRCTLTSGQVDGLRNWLPYLPEGLREARLKEFD